MTNYFSGLWSGIRVGSLASFGMPLLSADVFVHDFMDRRRTGLPNALSMAYRSSRGALGRAGEAYLWYMGNLVGQQGYDRSFFRRGVNIGLLAPAFGLFGIYRGARLYRSARNPFSRAAGVAMAALSVGGLYYGARRGLDFTGRLLDSYNMHLAANAEDANIPSSGLPGQVR